MNKEPDIIKFNEIKEKTGINVLDYNSGIYFFNNPDNIGPDSFFTVYKGDVELDYLGMADSYECEKRAYLVIGDLTVNGLLNMCGDDVGYPIQLYVTGNLKAKNISIAKVAEIIVLGNIEIEDSLFAIIMAGGQIYCGGDLSVNKAYIDEFPLKVKGKLKSSRFYVDIYNANYFDVPFEELINIVYIEVADDTEANIIRVADRIIIDDEILAIENDEVDYTDVEIDIIYRKHQIFTDEYEEGDVFYDNVKYFKEGKNFWNDKKFDVVAFNEIKEKTGINVLDYNSGIYFFNNPDEIDPDCFFTVYQGDVNFDDLELASLASSFEYEKRAYLIIGNLTVNGLLNMCGGNVGYPIQLYVTGNLKAKNISIATLSELIVLGNIEIENSLLALNPALAQIYCGGDLSVNKAYIENFPLNIKGEIKSSNFYVEISEPYNFDLPLEEFNIKVSNIDEQNIIKVAQRIIVDDEILAIENGETDFTDEEIENIYSKNQIFTPEFEETDIYHDNIEFFKKGKNIWNK